MHPFSLTTEESKEVTGGIVAGGCVSWRGQEVGEMFN